MQIMSNAAVWDGSDSSWRLARLGDVCEIQIGRTPRRNVAEYWHGNLPWVTISDLNNDVVIKTREKISLEGAQASRSRLVPKGTLLFSFKLTIGKMAIAGVDLYTNEAIAALTPRDAEQLCSEFLKYALMCADAGAGSSHAVKGRTLNQESLASLVLPLPPLAEQRRIAALLTEQLAAVERAREGMVTQRDLLGRLTEAHIRQSLAAPGGQRLPLQECLTEVTSGVGASWASYRVIGATRAGAAPAKENVGKRPERYKLVEPGTIFYNPMRILLGSIGIVDDGEEAGITSPDYVVFKASENVLHPRWFYAWLRSSFGETFIKQLARGAVRERLLFRRLANAEVAIPPLSVQWEVVERLRLVERTRRLLIEEGEGITKLPAAILHRAFSADLSKLLDAHTSKVRLKDNDLARGALASYIINRLYRHNTFGRVQFEKALYLTETFVGIDLDGQYGRKAAGPYDPATLYDLEHLAYTEGWFTRHSRGGEGHSYRPGPAIQDRLAAAEAILGDRRSLMDQLLNLMARMNTQRVEVVATLFAAWNDFLIDGIQSSEPQIVQEVRNNWHETKGRFSKELLLNELAWMKSNGLVPRGVGPHTEREHV